MEEADRHLRSAEILWNVKKGRMAVTRKSARKAKLVHIQAMETASAFKYIACWIRG